MWTVDVIIPAWRNENVASGVLRDGFRMPELKSSVAGRVYIGGRRFREALGLMIDPGAMLALAAVFLLVRYRRDWRACLVILLLIGTHTASLLVSSLLGIPAEGRYRFLTEPGALILFALAVIHLAVILWGWSKDVFRNELLPARRKSA
jgi:hypothetical protein